jgi:hypothetical protein
MLLAVGPSRKKSDEGAPVRTLSWALVGMSHTRSAFDHFSSLPSETYDCEGGPLAECVIGVSRFFYDFDGPTDATSLRIRENLNATAELPPD